MYEKMQRAVTVAKLGVYRDSITIPTKTRAIYGALRLLDGVVTLVGAPFGFVGCASAHWGIMTEFKARHIVLTQGDGRYVIRL